MEIVPALTVKESNPTPLSHSGKVAEMVPIKHKNRPLHHQEPAMRPRPPSGQVGRLYHNISGDATAQNQKYCIISGTATQAEH